MYIEANLENKILNYQTKNKCSSFEAYYTKFNSEDWEKSFGKAIYNNVFNSKYSTKEIDYFIVPRDTFIGNIENYLDRLRKYIDNGNYNTMILLNSNVFKYQEVLKLLNKKKILTLLYTNKKEDLYLEYTNLFVCVTDDLDIVKKYKLFKLD